MSRVFADAYYFVALRSRRDAGQQAVAEFTASFQGEMITTARVIMEAANACSPSSRRAAFLEMLAALRGDDQATIISATDELFQRGLDLFARRPDKDGSLTDCISFVVMDDEGLTAALTADHHFEQAGFAALFWLKLQEFSRSRRYSTSSFSIMPNMCPPARSWWVQVPA